MFGTYDKNVSTIKWPSLTAKIGKRRKKSFIGSAPGVVFFNLRVPRNRKVPPIQ